MRLTQLWAPSDGTTVLRTNDPDISHMLWADPEAGGTGQLHSFDAHDEIIAVVSNNETQPDEHGIFRTTPPIWRRFVEWVGWSDTSYIKLRSNSSSTFSKVGGNMGLLELWGVQYTRPGDNA